MMDHHGHFTFLLRELFTRVSSEAYPESENEFRILFKVQTPLHPGGLYSSPEPRVFRLHVDGIEYCGYVRYDRQLEDGPDSIDMYLRTNSPMIRNPYTTIVDLMRHRHTIRLIPEFRNVSIRRVASEFGYIGDKEKCREFLKDWMGKQIR